MAREIRRTSDIVVIDEIQKLPQLLDGRAWQTNLFPLTSAEIPDFSLDRYLLYGGLPQVYDSDEPVEELDAYINTYLNEEIKEEARVQNVPNFSRFLKIAALSSGEQLNYTNVANDTGLAASSVRSYFEILADTFVGFRLDPWRESKKR